MIKLDFTLHPKQMECFLSTATEILYGGGAGGGKSHLMRIAAIIWCLEISHLQIYLFRKTFPELEKNHLDGPTGFHSLLDPLRQKKKCFINKSKNYIEFYNSSKIHLCHCQHEKDVYAFQGAEIHVLMIDESTHFSAFVYKYLRGRTRKVGITLPKKYEGLFPRIICGSNPGGISHNFFKKSFVTSRPPLEIEQMDEDNGGLLRQYIPALLTDNRSLMEEDPNYKGRLKGLGNKQLVRAMLEGDWNILSGGALDDVWQAEIHILQKFKIPSGWYVDRGFDWGSSHPFSVLWFAEADGEEVPDGIYKGWCPPKGTLIIIAEWYGCSGEPNTGLKMSARDIAKGIKEREIIFKKNLLAPCIEEGHSSEKTIHAGPADNQIFSEQNENCIGNDMEDESIYWERSNKSAGTRVGGLNLIRDGLLNALQEYVEDPAIYIFNSCPELIDHLPVLPRDTKNTEDVDSSAEDHDYDVLRYRCLGTNQRPTNFKVRTL